MNINKDMVYKAAKSKEKDYMINDGGGLYMFVGKNGAKLWRLIYTFEKKQKNSPWVVAQTLL
ncbi:MAG: Arm DNA-binding domain-containing protein [Methylococcaceae bacterium]